MYHRFWQIWTKSPNKLVRYQLLVCICRLFSASLHGPATLYSRFHRFIWAWIQIISNRSGILSLSSTYIAWKSMSIPECHMWWLCKTLHCMNWMRMLIFVALYDPIFVTFVFANHAVCLFRFRHLHWVNLLLRLQFYLKTMF